VNCIHHKMVLTMLFVLPFLLFSNANAAPITFNTALPVSEGSFVFRQQLRWSRSSNQNQTLRSTAAISVLGYGINSDLALFGVLPYVDNRLEQSNSDRDNQGIADVTGFARYTLWKHDRQGQTLRLGGVAGLTAPTGDDNGRDSAGRLPPPLQNGSGAWDSFGALVATYQTLNSQISGQISYRNNRQANGFEIGDETRLDLSWQQRIWPKKLSGAVPGFLYGVLELNALHQDRNRNNGQNNSNSGGNTIWLSPGVQYVTRRWVFEAIIQTPIVQNLNGNAFENDLIITTGFRRNF